MKKTKNLKCKIHRAKALLAKALVFAIAATLSLNASLLDLGLNDTKQVSDTGKAKETVAYADDQQAFPYTKTFIITSYYSPLPGQKHYVTGSYASDIRLNGNGTNGADGTPVYAGMVAAPKSYPFGTKLYVPGVGMTAVHDRGGAIVEGKGDDPDATGPKHDRLDIWMGYGDKGLTRALNWGAKTVDVTIYGVDDSISENVEIVGYSPDEKTNQEVFYIPDYTNSSNSSSSNSTKKTTTPKVTPKKDVLFPEDLWYLDEGPQVKKLQEYLKKFGYYTDKIDGKFGDSTRMAVYLFQKDKGLISDITDIGAGHFGGKTRQTFEDAIVNKKEDLTPKITLGISSTDKDSIKKLQNALKVLGYNVDVNGKYDKKTIDAVFKFQIENKVVSGEGDAGAGYFGPKTMTKLSASISNLYASGKVSMTIAHASSDINDMIESKQVLTPPMSSDLKFGDKGPDVTRLQQELKNLNLLRIDPTGEYGDVTKHAVFKFQQINNLVADESSEFAGVFGPTTRSKLNEIIASKNFYNKKISEKRLQKDS